MTSAIQMIPLNRLIPSPRNVRKTDRKVDIEMLAASIAARGLLQNLCVVETTEGKFEVDAGGRRLAALKLLARDKVIAKDHPVACNVIALEEGREVSLVENVHRVGMDAIDEVEAYASLVADGADPDDVARRFGVTRRHVDQRLALSGLSPRIKAAWKRGDVSLDAARAFCLVEDHAQQDAVFKSLGKPLTHAPSVRARLMEGRVRASDRLVKFVGLEAYERAGGALTRDLFDADAVYIVDPALVARLAEEKLEAERQGWLDQGWGWADIHLGQGRPDGYAASRIQPVWRDATPEEEAELQRLQSEMDELDEALDEDSVEDDPRWETRDTLAGQIETIRQAARVWPRELIAHAGVVLSIDYDGNECVTCGLIRQADEKTVRAMLAKAAKEAAGEEVLSDGEASGADEICDIDLPKAVIRELSQARTRAIRALLAEQPGTALAVAVAAILLRSRFRCELPGVGISAHASRVGDEDTLAAGRDAFTAGLPQEETEVLPWALSLSVPDLLNTLAILTASAIDLTHEKGTVVDAGRRLCADRLAMALDIDMGDHWRADAGYWTRLSKAQLIAAIETAPRVDSMADNKRAGLLKAYAKLKREALATKVEEAFAGVTYLPDFLVTSIAAGSFEVTDAGYVAVAAE
jgi:ParB family chromosome partitioning protein